MTPCNTPFEASQDLGCWVRLLRAEEGPTGLVTPFPANEPVWLGLSGPAPERRPMISC